eukprot:TRINITY_DN10495_c0_g1_i5.p2 TRINITY_DN10495_c0_g1~~TRINITY_DN10495_c0_g1_i5.p2  ORF type:complete len:162 (+),score=20.36 TRINITY_DN10495_c0_g1_i5:152-637(+)
MQRGLVGSEMCIRDRSKAEMIPGIWYNAAGVVDQSGTTTEETLRIYVNGTYPTSPTFQGINPTGKKYLVSPNAVIRQNLSFNVASYSEVPFPLSGPEITAVYAAEKDDPRQRGGSWPKYLMYGQDGENICSLNTPYPPPPPLENHHFDSKITVCQAKTPLF